MASLVNPSNINGNFPIAGQDNDSQGFRDNFTNIRNNFTFIKSEIEDLQAKAVLKSALIGTTLNNDFQGSKVKNLQVSNLTETVKDLGQFSTGDLQIDLAEGNIIKLVADAANPEITINQTIKNWPASLQYARILMYINIPSPTITITLPSNWTTDLSSLPNTRIVDSKPVIGFTDPGDYIYEITSVDSGTTVFIRELTTGNPIFRDPNLYMLGFGIGKSSDVPRRSGYSSPTLMIGFGNYLSASAIESGVPYLIDDRKSGNDTLMLKGSVTSYQSKRDDSANVSLGGYTNTGLNSLTSAGFSVVADRTFIDTGAGNAVSLSQVNDNDLVGYYNAIGYTYNNSPATTKSYQQLGAVQFVSNGSASGVLGIGGKILIKTKGDGATDAAMPNQTVGGYNYYATRGYLRTAVEIDNKQNVTVYGNLSVLGQTTVVQSQVVTIQDKNLILGAGGVYEETNQGAGITVESDAADGGANIILNATGWITNRSFTFANISAANTLIVNGRVNFRSNAWIAGNLMVAGTLYQNGGRVATGSETIQGVLSVTNSTASTSTSTGALVVTGGVGVGNGLYVNGTTYVQNFSTANAQVTGGSLFNITALTATGSVLTTLRAENFTSANIWTIGGCLGVSPATGQVLPVANIYATLGYMASVSSPNVLITGGSITGHTSAASTSQATNFSSSNVAITGGYIQTVSNLYATGIGNFGSVRTSNVSIAAGTTSQAPLTFTSGTNLTTPVAGAMEFDGQAFYATPFAGQRGLVPSTFFYSLASNVNINNGTAPAITTFYNGFGTTAGVATVAGSTTYEVEGRIMYGFAGTPTAGTVLFSFGGSATYTSYNYQVTTFGYAGLRETAANSATYFGTTSMPSTTSGVVQSAQGYSNFSVYFKGIIRINASGTLAPQIGFGTAPGQVTAAVLGSYVKYTPVGTSANVAVGSFTG